MSYKTTNDYRGWKLVETSQNYYHACKGSLRVAVGSIRHGDREGLTTRFKKIVDGLEDEKCQNHCSK